MIAIATKTGLQPDAAPFAPQHRWDRNFFLIYLALIWLGMAMGFGGDIATHIAKHRPSWPLIVHVHAAAFVSFLLLFTAQILLIRSRRLAIHRTLGLAAFVLVPLMVILGPAAAFVMDNRALGTPDADPAFLILQIVDIVSLAGLASAALWLRRRPAAHKRLMLLAVLAISDAGFARWLGDPLHKIFGEGFWPFWLENYPATDTLIVGMAVYDLVTRRRLHPATLIGGGWILASHLIICWLYYDPTWKAVSLKLLGH